MRMARFGIFAAADGAAIAALDGFQKSRLRQQHLLEHGTVQQNRGVILVGRHRQWMEMGSRFHTFPALEHGTYQAGERGGSDT
jgi:hypothetical protein